MPTPMGEPIPKGPDVSAAKLPLPGLNQVQVETAYQGMRIQLKKAAAPERSINSKDAIVVDSADGVKIALDDGEKVEVVRLLNEDHGEAKKSSDKVEQCETVYGDTGKQFKTREQAQKATGLVADENGRFTGQFFRIDPLDPDKKRIIEENVAPAMGGGIKSLRRLASEGDQEAQKTYETLRESNSVRVTYTSTDNGSPQERTVTLQEFDNLIETEAANLWMAKHPEMPFDVARQKFPQIAHAYRIKAEMKIDTNAKYSLHHLDATKSGTSDQPNTPDAEDLASQEATADFDLVAEACGQEIASLADGMMGDLIGSDEANSLLVIDEHGKIKGINYTPENQKKLQELLKDRKPDDKTYALYSLVQQLGAYLENRADPVRGWRIATTLFYTLQSTHPGKQLNLNFKYPERFEINMKKIVQEMVDQYFLGHFPTGAINSIMEKNPLRLLSLAMTLREKKMMTTDPRGAIVPKNSKGLHEIIAEWGLTEADKEFVYHFASEPSLIETALQNNFGLDANSLQDPEVQGRHITQVLNHVVPQRLDNPDNEKLRDEVSDVYREILSDTISDGTLDKIKKEHSLLGILKGIGMIALIFGPGAQGLLGLDVGDEEKQQR